MRYNPQKIESKWQKLWLKEKIYEPDFKKSERPFYNLMMFPYPSAEGLHVGNMYAFTGSDIYGRFKRMQGNDVFEPIGLDGFGIHSENYALKTGRHPAEQAEISEKNFYRQLQMLGNGFAWNEHLETYDSEYYKWTQWIFTEMYKRGLAYRQKAPVNWCPSCKTVLADEQAAGGKCERCNSEVERKDLEQWFFKITDYAEKLLKNLEKIDWSEKVKIAQKNWIGKSEGAEINFALDIKFNYVLLHGFTGSSKKNFFPWLNKELRKRGFKSQALDLPNSADPKEKEWVNYALKRARFDENTVLFGHSLGAVTALKILEKLDKPIAGVVLTGGFINPEVLYGLRVFQKNFDWKFDFKKIKKNAGFIKILSDLNDIIIPVSQGREMHKKLGGELIETIGEKEHFTAAEEPVILESLLPQIKVFTTRPDTLFGATYMVVAPEHPIIKNFQFSIFNFQEVEKYIASIKTKSEVDRVAEGKEKTGVEIKDIRAINPANNEEIPIFVADYVLGNVGTGAIMAVPAHDERDFEFAKKYKLPIKQVIAPTYLRKEGDDAVRDGVPFVERTTYVCIVKHWSEEKYLGVHWTKNDWQGFVTGGAKEGEDFKTTGAREIREETGFASAEFVKTLGLPIHSKFYQAVKKENRYAHYVPLLYKLRDGKQMSIAEDEKALHKVKWLTPKEMDGFINRGDMKIFWERVKGNDYYTGTGILANSGKFDSLDSEKAKWEITEFVGGEKKTQYRLRDWLISRQRYWGPPIPMIFCEKCQWQPVPERDLPVKLPFIKNFRPTGTDKSPLAADEKFYKVRCPKCKGWARRETDVSDTFLDSAWYYLGYLILKNPKSETNSKFQIPKEIIKKWCPVDMYIGGAEHSVLHLLYVRFLAMALNDWGLIDFAEPFKKFRAHGLIIKDGAKMSKSKGNVANPDDYIKAYGADALRMYLMFLGPFEQGGDFRDTGIRGITRFLERVWRLTQSVILRAMPEGSRELPSSARNDGEGLKRFVHKTIKKITEDIENLQYNTAISALMILLNEFEENFEAASPKDLEIFLKLLAPFAPHLTEELWQKIFVGEGLFKSIHKEKWPEYDPKMLQENIFDLIIQINGRFRGTIKLSKSAGEDEVKRAALELPEVKKYVSGKPRRVIYLKHKLINFVV